jgi:uncharacterized protein YbjT (DUF2867 family)
MGVGAMRSALLVGASGLVGARLLTRLLAHPKYERVTIWVRRPVSLGIHKFAQVVVDFDRLHEHTQQLVADDVYVALGTTIKNAGSKEAFRRVDHNYPVEIARIAVRQGVKRFLMVSALGADMQSRVFYNRVKGEVETDIRAIGLPKVWFFRPSLLVGARAESRPGERLGIAIGKVIAPLMIGGLRRYRPISADAVAAAMIYAAMHDVQMGVVESEEIARLARLSPY